MTFRDIFSKIRLRQSGYLFDNHLTSCKKPEKNHEPILRSYTVNEPTDGWMEKGMNELLGEQTVGQTETNS